MVFTTWNMAVNHWCSSFTSDWKVTPTFVSVLESNIGHLHLLTFFNALLSCQISTKLLFKIPVPSIDKATYWRWLVCLFVDTLLNANIVVLCHFFLVCELVINTFYSTWFSGWNNALAITSSHTEVSWVVSSFPGAVWWLVDSFIFAEWCFRYWWSIIFLNVPNRVQCISTTCETFVKMANPVAHMIWDSTLLSITIITITHVTLLHTNIVISCLFSPVKAFSYT